MPKPSPEHKIGLYIRVSTEEQAKNPEGSIKSQEQRLREHIEFKNRDGNFGEVAGIFVDGGKSGKDTNRVQLQKMLRAIRRGEIDMVMVTELSRLSRSIKDFSEIWELMKAHGCKFLCLREQFDTTTAAGEMVLFTIANISQFERKQISERVKANMSARARRGLYNGGPVPFGYEFDDCANGRLKIVANDAEIVREAYATYLSEGTLLAAVRNLNERGFRLKRLMQGGGRGVRLGQFTIDNLRRIIRNPAYIGERRYEEEGNTKTTKACWEALIDTKLYQRANALLSENHEKRTKRATGRRYPYLLSGLTVCGHCGDRLPGKSAHGASGKVCYYEHGWATRKGAALNKKIFDCQPTRVPARILEPLVWNSFVELLLDKEFAKRLIVKANHHHEVQGFAIQANKLRQKMTTTHEQLDALGEHLAKLPKHLSPSPIFKQMEKLEKLKREQQAELEAIQASDEYVDKPASLKDYEKFLRLMNQLMREGATPEEKAKLVRFLVDKVEVYRDRVKVFYKVGESVVKSSIEQPRGEKKALDAKDAPLGDGDTKREKIFWPDGSNRLTKSAPGRIRTSDPEIRSLVLYPTELRVRNP